MIYGMRSIHGELFFKRYKGLKTCGIKAFRQVGLNLHMFRFCCVVAWKTLL